MKVGRLLASILRHTTAEVAQDPLCRHGICDVMRRETPQSLDGHMALIIEICSFEAEVNRMDVLVRET